LDLRTPCLATSARYPFPTFLNVATLRAPITLLRRIGVKGCPKKVDMEGHRPQIHGDKLWKCPYLAGFGTVWHFSGRSKWCGRKDSNLEPDQLLAGFLRILRGTDPESPIPPRPLHRDSRPTLIGDRKPLRPARTAARATGLRGHLMHGQLRPVDFGHRHASRVPAEAFQPDGVLLYGGEFCHPPQIDQPRFQTRRLP